jgi:hypothetical protein
MDIKKIAQQYVLNKYGRKFVLFEERFYREGQWISFFERTKNIHLEVIVDSDKVVMERYEQIKIEE